MSETKNGVVIGDTRYVVVNIGSFIKSDAVKAMAKERSFEVATKEQLETYFNEFPERKNEPIIALGFDNQFSGELLLDLYDWDNGWQPSCVFLVVQKV